MTISKKQLSEVMSDLGKKSAKVNKKKGPAYWKALQKKSVKTRLKNKAKMKLSPEA